jgi:hypothetical protein
MNAGRITSIVVLGLLFCRLASISCGLAAQLIAWVWADAGAAG